MPRLALILPLMLLSAACGSRHAGVDAPRLTGARLHVAGHRRQGTLACRLRRQPRPRHRLHVQSLSGVAVVRSADREALRGLPDQGVAVVAINPDNPKALRLDELSHTDVGESLDDMKTRAEHRRLAYPYLSGGEALAKQFKVVATPQIFVFDKNRALRYQGRIDNSAREDAITSRDARNAIDALLAGRPVSVAETTAVGCPPTFLSKPGGPEVEQAAIAAEPVTLEMVGADGLKKLRQNGTGKLLMINFWATWCAPCVAEFPISKRPIACTAAAAWIS